MSDRLGTPDASSARQLQQCYGQQPDGTGAEYRGRLAGVWSRELHGVQHDGQRFHKSAFPMAEAGRQRKQVVRRQIDELAKETRFIGLAQEPQVGADVVMAGHAELEIIDRKSTR